MFVVDRRRSTAKFGAALAIAAFVAGCSSSASSPTTLPPISTTPAASASTAPAPDPKAAAVAVVKEYFRLLNNLEQQMDAEGFEAIETANCPCHKLVRSIREARSAGQHYYGHATVRDVTPVTDSSTQVQVLVVYDSTPGGLRRSDGQTVTQGPGRIGVTENFYVQRLNGRWLISNVLAIRSGRPR